MTTKSELIEKLESLLDQEEIEAASEHVETLKSSYEEVLAEEEKTRRAEADAALAEKDEAESLTDPPETEELSPPIESAQDLSEEDKRFKHLVDTYNAKVNDLRKARIAEEKENLAKKQDIIDRLDKLIEQEENIGNAFNTFKEIQAEWKSIGNIPQQQYREIQKSYSDKLDTFFYTIRIYKELREHDLKKNAGLKEALSTDMEALANSTSIKEMEVKIKEYQEQWKEIGPVVKEEWERIGDRFWSATRTVYEKVGEHYKAKRAVHEENLKAKQDLVDEVKKITAEAEAHSVKEWKQLTDKVLQLQTDWKKIGFATKKDNERIWQEFRHSCNQFFDKKHEFFGGIKEGYEAAKTKKTALITKAEELQTSTEWRETAEAYKKLQAAWKEVGFAGNRNEHKLWGKFRAACDTFFEARSAHFDEQDKAQKQNVEAKSAILTEMQSFSLSGNKGKDLGKLKAFSTQWNEAGRIPQGPAKKMIPIYRELMDKFYGQLDLNQAEKSEAQLQGKLDSIKRANDPKKEFEHAKRQIKRKIDFLKTDVRQYEQNLAMFNFKSASGEAMKKDIEKKIDRAQRDIENLLQQQKQLSKRLKSDNQP